MSFFGVGGNAFATQVGMKIERATSETLPSEDWTLNMEICDLVNHAEDGPKDAMKAIRKRLATQPKNYTVVMYTLTVLETCVKNCGKRFHILVCSKDFVQELVKLIGPKNDPPAAVQEKVLYLIQSWAKAFKYQADFAGVSQVYADLRHKGVEFPPSSGENATPILTPQRSNDAHHASTHVTSLSPSRRVPSNSYGMELSGCPSEGQTTLTSEQKAKLHSELDLVESNAKVLAEMLNELTPGKEQGEDLRLLQDLYATCRIMQERVVELVAGIGDDLLTADLLRINDDLNNLFVRYERHMSKKRAMSSSGTSSVKSPQRTSTLLPQPSSPKKEEAPLIDLGDDAPPTEQLATLNIGKKNEDVDFDAFAQSRTSAESGKASDSAAPDAAVRDQKLSEFDEMEHWLKQNQTSSKPEGDSKPEVREDSVSSSEFDRFLAERAAAADNLPTIPAATGSTSIDQQRSRTLKEDQKEKQLFSL